MSTSNTACSTGGGHSTYQRYLRPFKSQGVFFQRCGWGARPRKNAPGDPASYDEASPANPAPYNRPYQETACPVHSRSRSATAGRSSALRSPGESPPAHDTNRSLSSPVSPWRLHTRPTAGPGQAITGRRDHPQGSKVRHHWPRLAFDRAAVLSPPLQATSRPRHSHFWPGGRRGQGADGWACGRAPTTLAALSWDAVPPLGCRRHWAKYHCPLPATRSSNAVSRPQASSQVLGRGRGCG